MGRTCSWAGAGCGALLALGACFPQFGEYVGDGGAGGRVANVAAGGSGGAMLPESCGADGLCIEVPTGWEGPVVLSVPGGGCRGSYARALADGEANIAGEPASCGCECGQAGGSTCSSATVTRYFLAGCSNPQIDTTTVSSAGCAAISFQNAGSWKATAVATGGSCPALDMQSIPQAMFDERTVCGIDPLPSCEGGFCAPRPGEGFEPRICMLEEGDVDCTSPSFAVKTLVFTGGHEDSRQCDVPCACQPPSAICGGAVIGRQGMACGASQDGLVVDGSCDDSYVASNGSLTYAPTLTSEGTCEPVPRAAVGEVVGLSPITLCCSGIL